MGSAGAGREGSGDSQNDDALLGVVCCFLIF